MEIFDAIRKPFDVKYVEVTLQNVEEVAAWCKGTVGEAKVKMMGAETVLPCVELKGQGNKKAQMFTAQLGHYIVEHKGSFRVYRPQQFEETFEQAPREPLKRMDFVEVIDGTSGYYRWQGVVEEVQQTVVSFGNRGNFRFDEAELKRISEIDEQQLEKNSLRGEYKGVQLDKPRPTNDFGSVGRGLEFMAGEKMADALENSESKRLAENDWVRVKNSSSEYYDWAGFVTVLDVEHQGLRGVEVLFSGDREVKAVFHYSEIEHYSVV